MTLCRELMAATRSDLGFVAAAVDAPDIADELQKPPGRHLPVEGAFLGHVPQGAAHLDRLGPDVETPDGCRAAVGLDEAGKHAQGCRLPGAVGADKPHDVALLRLERDVVDGNEIAIGFSEILDGYHYFVRLQLCPVIHCKRPAKLLRSRASGLGMENPESDPWLLC
jgi:hypothetical protein